MSKIAVAPEYQTWVSQMTKSKLIAALVTSTLFWVAPSGAFANTVDSYNIPNVSIGPSGTINGSLTVDWTTDTVTALSITTSAIPSLSVPGATYTSGVVVPTNTVQANSGGNELLLFL